jgi:hypothetical protein
VLGRRALRGTVDDDGQDGLGPEVGGEALTVLHAVLKNGDRCSVLA